MNLTADEDMTMNAYNAETCIHHRSAWSMTNRKQSSTLSWPGMLSRTPDD